MLLIETHGPVTDNVDSMAELLAAPGHEETVGLFPARVSKRSASSDSRVLQFRTGTASVT